MKSIKTHPIHNSVAFDTMAMEFRVFHTSKKEGTMMLGYRGIHRLIQSVFYPAFDYTKVKASRPRVAYEIGNVSKEEYFNRLAKQPQATGKEGGILFSKTVEDCHLLAMHEADVLMAEKDVLYRSFMKFVVENKYEILEAEMILMDPFLGYATWVDLVVAKNGRVYFVEIKTGYSHGAFLSGTGHMKRVAGMLFKNDCKRNQAMLQALLPALTVARFARVCVTPVVWHVEPSGVTEYLPEWNLGDVGVRERLHGTVLKDINDAAEVEKKESLLPPIKRLEDTRKRQKVLSE
ncbi:MAG: hypothetical protein AB7P49_04120 [Bdellovibrionales bacterium]